MDENRIRDLIGDVARHGEGLPQRVDAAELRHRGGPAGGGREASRRPDPSRWRRNLGRTVAAVALIVVAAPVVGALVYVAIPASSHAATATSRESTTSTLPDKRFTTTTATPGGIESRAQAIVGRAVAKDDSYSNFDLSFDLEGNDGLGSGSGVTGSGTADLAPSIAMTLNDVEGATLWFGPDDAWESLGSVTEFTLSGFSDYAENVVGQDAGALGTFGFCSPTGLLDLSQNEIGPTTEVGTATVDGVSTTEYSVTVNPISFLSAPGITSGELQAIKAAIGVIHGASITDDIYIDAAGNLVQTVSSADGATLTVNLSNFGDAGTVTLPQSESSITSTVPTTASTYTECSSGQTGATTTTTTGMDTETTPTDRPVLECRGSTTSSS